MILNSSANTVHSLITFPNLFIFPSYFCFELEKNLIYTLSLWVAFLFCVSSSIFYSFNWILVPLVIYFHANKWWSILWPFILFAFYRIKAYKFLSKRDIVSISRTWNLLVVQNDNASLVQSESKMHALCIFLTGLMVTMCFHCAFQNWQMGLFTLSTLTDLHV